jgi:hypothetical protein
MIIQLCQLSMRNICVSSAHDIEELLDDEDDELLVLLLLSEVEDDDTESSSLELEDALDVSDGLVFCAPRFSFRPATTSLAA